VFESRVQRSRFGHERDDVKREWTKVGNEELNGLFFSPVIFWVMKSSGMMWAMHVSRIGKRKEYTGVWWGNLRKRDRLEGPSID